MALILSSTYGSEVHVLSTSRSKYDKYTLELWISTELVPENQFYKAKMKIFKESVFYQLVNLFKVRFLSLIMRPWGCPQNRETWEVCLGAQYKISRGKNWFSSCQGLSQAAPLRQSHTAIGIVPLRNGQGDNLFPSNFREKTRKEANTKRFISVQKLRGRTWKYILSHL